VRSSSAFCYLLAFLNYFPGGFVQKSSACQAKEKEKKIRTDPVYYYYYVIFIFYFLNFMLMFGS
jgi:hypothetical protein